MNTVYPPPHSLIDHRGVMAFVDELVWCDDVGARCKGTIRADNPFLVGDHLPSWVVIEFIAQTVAVFAGYRRKTHGDDHRHGLLLGCRSMTLTEETLYIGDQLELAIEEVARLDSFGSFKGSVSRAGILLGSGVLAVVETQTWPDRLGRMESD